MARSGIDKNKVGKNKVGKTKVGRRSRKEEVEKKK
jgi:hypothetical protein